MDGIVSRIVRAGKNIIERACSFDSLGFVVEQNYWPQQAYCMDEGKHACSLRVLVSDSWWQDCRQDANYREVAYELQRSIPIQHGDPEGYNN